jgi:hypothetical protein
MALAVNMSWQSVQDGQEPETVVGAEQYEQSGEMSRLGDRCAVCARPSLLQSLSQQWPCLDANPEGCGS